MPTRHPRYNGSDKPILVGDLVYRKDEVYEIDTIAHTSLGCIVSGTSPDTGRTFATDATGDISPVPEDLAANYTRLNETKTWRRIFEIAEKNSARICKVDLIDPTEPATGLTEKVFALVPDSINLDRIAPWAVCAIHPTQPVCVAIQEIDDAYPAPNNLRKFAESLVQKCDSNELAKSRHLWLIRPNDSPAAWEMTELDRACDALETTYMDYDMAPEDVAPHFENMTALFRLARPDMRDESPERTSYLWWSGYAKILANG